MHNLDLNIENGPRSNVNIPMESQWETSYVLVIAMFGLSPTVYEKCSRNMHDLEFER